MLAEILARLQEKQASAGESGIDAAFELNWESLSAEAQKLACLLSLFALAPIPWSLAESAASASNIDIDLDVNRTTLVQQYIIQQLDEDTCQIHERIRGLVLSKLENLAESDELKRGFCEAMVAVAQDIPQTPTLEKIIKVTAAIPHLTEAATTYQDWLSDEDLIWPFIGLGQFYEGQGAYQQALPWREQCLSATRQRLGEAHPDVAASLNNLALLYNSQGRYSEAEPLYLQALELYKLLLGKAHPDVANSLNNLAGFYYSQGRYSEAEPLYLQALELRTRLLGEAHPDVATSLNNLAKFYYSQGCYSEAEPLLLQALDIAERSLGANHPDTISIRENLQLLRDNRQS